VVQWQCKSRSRGSKTLARRVVRALKTSPARATARTDCGHHGLLPLVKSPRGSKVSGTPTAFPMRSPATRCARAGPVLRGSGQVPPKASGRPLRPVASASMPPRASIAAGVHARRPGFQKHSAVKCGPVDAAASNRAAGRPGQVKQCNARQTSYRRTGTALQSQEP